MLNIEVSEEYDQLLVVKFKKGKVMSAAFYVLPKYKGKTVDIKGMAEKAIAYLQKGKIE